MYRSSADGGGGEDDSYNQSVKAESLSENKDENHSDVDVLLGVGAYTSITDNSNAESGSEGGETTAKSTSEMSVGVVVRVLGVNGGATGAHGASGGRGGVSDYTRKEGGN